MARSKPPKDSIPDWQENMGTRIDYHSRADECVRLAQDAKPQDRTLLLQIAKTWLKLAELALDDDSLWVNDRDKHLHS